VWHYGTPYRQTLCLRQLITNRRQFSCRSPRALMSDRQYVRRSPPSWRCVEQHSLRRGSAQVKQTTGRGRPDGKLSRDEAHLDAGVAGSAIIRQRSDASSIDDCVIALRGMVGHSPFVRWTETTEWCMQAMNWLFDERQLTAHSRAIPQPPLQFIVTSNPIVHNHSQ
jgi:hypothetical protein